MGRQKWNNCRLPSLCPTFSSPTSCSERRAPSAGLLQGGSETEKKPHARKTPGHSGDEEDRGMAWKKKLINPSLLFLVLAVILYLSIIRYKLFYEGKTVSDGEIQMSGTSCTILLRQKQKYMFYQGTT